MSRAKAVLCLLIALPGRLLPAQNSCIPVVGERIRGSDLIAAGVPADPALDLGPSPLPGLTRVPRPGQPFHGHCFALQTTPLTQDAVEAAMKRTFAGLEVQVSIFDFSRVEIPISIVEFLKDALPYPPKSASDASVLWRGRAVHSSRHSVPIWARVRLSVRLTYLEATREIVPGHVLQEDDVVTRNAWVFPSSKLWLTLVNDAVGRTPTRRIAEGDRLDSTVLTAPHIVHPGETIEVRVTGSATQLRSSAIAERGGKLGETITARNEQSGKRFRVKVTAPGQAVVILGERI